MSEPARQLSSSLEWVRPPKQARSQKTLERLLDAAEQLISEKGVEAITVSAVVGRAGSSVGAFYARFGDKESLLRCVCERFFEEANATATAALEPTRWDGVPLREAIEISLRFVVDVFVQRRGVVAAVTTRSTTIRSTHSLAMFLTKQISEQLLTLLDHRGQAVVAADRDRAVGTVIWLVISALSSWALSGLSSSAYPSDRNQFASDVADMCFQYLFSAAPSVAPSR